MRIFSDGRFDQIDTLCPKKKPGTFLTGNDLIGDVWLNLLLKLIGQCVSYYPIGREMRLCIIIINLVSAYTRNI